MPQQMPYIPSEVIFEILLRLPVKSLVRFRSVSKSWLSLLSSPQFINTHLNFSRNNHKDVPHKLLLLAPEQISSEKKCALYSSVSGKTSVDCVDLDYPVKSPGCVTQFIGSCDGLVCLSVENSLILWNPSTRIWKEIPKEPPFMNQDCFFTYGFGYDEWNDDYKLVLVYSSKNKNSENEVKVYSLKANSWKGIKSFHSGYVYSNSGVLVNGVVHWDTRPHPDFNGCHHSIVSFDLATEKQGKLDLPSYHEHEDVHWDLMSSGDQSLFGFCHCESQGEVDIWVMKEYGVEESWTKFASVAYYVIPGIFYLPLYINKDGDVLLINGQSLVLFNTRNNMCKDLQIHIPDTRRRIDLATYNESLVSPVFDDEDGCTLW
ncbi:hypothetical protein HAX54_028161 [Datura stramonium]|uniref:F-box domain-containing protein n=1 Tax=Datura stramonium TaxID=4076 RepID=A0ABS8V4U0_DATST|nr:hypothetical protein [Datura stramonium]